MAWNSRLPDLDTHGDGARYREEQQRGIMGNILAGALAANYADNTNRNASQLGALGNDYTQDFVKFGPRRIIDRCVVDR